MELIIPIIIIAIIVWIVVGLVQTILSNIKEAKRWIPCDGCGKMVTVRRSEYKKEEHKAGLTEYYCRDCVAAGRNKK